MSLLPGKSEFWDPVLKVNKFYNKIWESEPHPHSPPQKKKKKKSQNTGTGFRTYLVFIVQKDG